MTLLAAACSLLTGACGKAAPSAAQDRASAAPAGTPASAMPTAAAPPAATGHYRVDVSPPAGCSAGAPCEATLRVTALGAFKVNREYPHKLVLEPTATVALEGPGTFTSTEKHTGTLVVRFTAPATGTAKLAGTFKLSVCTDEACHIEQAPVEFDVPVT